MRRGLAYKNSGIAWLGEIPTHWEVKRIKFLATYNDEVLPEDTAPEIQINYVDISSVDVVAGITHIEPLEFGEAPSRARRIVRDGDTVISTVRTYLKAIASIRKPAENMIVSTGFAVIRPKENMLPDFLGYFLQDEGFVGEMVSLSVGVSYPAINACDLAGIAAVNPPLAEQRAIADFLDRETAWIDALIEKKQRQVALLKEKRLAQINQVVTRGLNPGVELRDSGIEWLGEIPVHWEVKRLRNLTEMRVSNVDKHTKDGEAPVRLCNYVDVYKNDYIDQQINFMQATATSREIERFRLQKGDVLITKDSEAWDDIGAPALVTEPADDLISGYHLALLRPLTGVVTGRFLLRLLQSKATVHQFSVRARGVTRYALLHGDIKSVSLAVPPLAEQRAIADFLDRETAHIDALVGKIEQSVELLRERRGALITAAVTGKIDVRGRRGTYDCSSNHCGA